MWSDFGGAVTRSVLAGMCLALCAASSQAEPLRVVPYDRLAAELDGRIGFDGLPRRPEPGLSLDHPLPVDGAWVGAAFAGQAGVIRQSGDGARHDGIGDARADAPLRLVGQGPGQGLAFAHHRGFGSVAVFPLGPDGFGRISGRGEGALAVLFAQDQRAVGLRIHSDYPDPLGSRQTASGDVEILMMARDGRMIGRHAVRLGPGITEIGLERSDGQPGIAGFVLLNTDPGGIAVDDILFARAALLGAAPRLTAPGQARRISTGKERETAMTKGYWVAHVQVDDPEIYEEYKRANAAPFAEFGARFIVRGGEQQVREGEARGRTVVIEFPTYEAALACFDSPAYQQAKAIRDPISSADMVIVKGYDG